MKINKLDEDWRDGKFDEGEFKAYSSRIIKDASRLSFSIGAMKRKHPELDSQFKELFNTVKNIFDDGYSNESMDEAIGSRGDPAWLHDGTPEYRLDNDEDSGDWERAASKSVTDSDGFQTDYTMYKNSDGKYIFIFGDSDLYEADPDYADYEADNEEEAQEWFDDYRGPGEDIEECAETDLMEQADVITISPYGNIPLVKYDDLQKDNYRYLDYDPVHKVDLYERIKK